MKYQISNIKYQIFLIIILLLAIFLRIYQLGNNPPALDWDEASLGYNAYSILKTGKDEFGRFLPVSIRSFEDYKPAVYTYVTIPSVAIFGLTEFAVRLPSAIFGSLTVLTIYFLIKELFDEKMGLLTSFLISISPWHLQFSRVAFESNVALFFVSSGILFFLKGLKNGKWFFLSSVSFVISFYTYHSPRLVVPLLLLGWSTYFREQIWKQKKWVIVASLIGFILLIPFIKEILGEGKARFSSVTVLTAEGRLEDSINRINYDQSHGDIFGKLLHNRRIIYAYAVVKGYLDHFNLDFLFFKGDAPDRHHARDMGMLYMWEGPFILIGILFLLQRKNHLPLLWWFLVAPAASAITTGTPHAVRALLYLPLYQIFTAVGVLYVLTYIRSKNIIKKVFWILLSLGIFVNVYYYIEMYYIHTPIEASQDWQYGYKQAIAEMSPYLHQVDHVVMTYAYDQPYIFVLFYQKIDPAWYQSLWKGGAVLRSERKFDIYEFRHIDWEKDKNLTNTIFVGTPGEIPETVNGKIKDILFLDQTIAFRIVKR